MSCLSKKKKKIIKKPSNIGIKVKTELQTTGQNVQSLASNENPACYGVKWALFHSLLSDYNLASC